MRRSVIVLLTLAVAKSTIVAAQTRVPVSSAKQPFSVVEATIPQMQGAMRERHISSREIVLQYLARIAMFEDKLNAVIAVNPRAIDPRRDPREATADGRPALAAGGSSSGIGTAANFWAANVGTETAGSLLVPASQTMLVGIKPTVGRVSRYGVIPLTADQDTPGAMAKTVTDAAILLGALEGATPDPNDPATTTCTPPPNRDYTRFLKPGGLKGARIGIPRAFYYDMSDEMDVAADRERYQNDRAKDLLLSATNGIDAVIKQHHLDALLFPGWSGFDIAARPGYPTVIVPFGFVPNAPMPPFPEGLNAKPAPFGVSFTGTACSEPRLIELAYALEQATKRRVASASVP
jgi:Asp-tRNA(Asn)/Glu-tRNA(Gln) amidotransferase A subunit family amidase